MKILLHTLLTIILITLISQANNEIHLELTPTTCLPGDLVELKATSTSPTYQQFTLTIPKNKNLQLIAKETTPVTLKKNQYTQTTLYIFQAIAPGQHTLSNITANLTSNQKLTSTNNPAPIKLTPITLTVGTYPSLDQDLTPASFPSTTKQSPTPLHHYLLLLIPAFLCTYIIKTNKLKSTPPEETIPPLTIDTLKAVITKGNTPEVLYYQLLEQTPSTLTKTQKKLIEQALYNPSFTPTDLLTALNKEEQP